MNTVVLGLLGILAIWGLIDMARAWRQTPVVDKPAWGPAWATRRRDARRSAVVSEVGVIALIVGYARPDTVLVSLPILLGSGLLLVAIHFFNRPRFLVPPALRHEPGALARFQRDRQGRRPNDAPP